MKMRGAVRLWRFKLEGGPARVVAVEGRWCSAAFWGREGRRVCRESTADSGKWRALPLLMGFCGVSGVKQAPEKGGGGTGKHVLPAAAPGLELEEICPHPANELVVILYDNGSDALNSSLASWRGV